MIKIGTPRRKLTYMELIARAIQLGDALAVPSTIPIRLPSTPAAKQMTRVSPAPRRRGGRNCTKSINSALPSESKPLGHSGSERDGCRRQVIEHGTDGEDLERAQSLRVQVLQRGCQLIQGDDGADR